MEKLDYNDQCDLVFGRIRRLVDQRPEVFDVTDASDLPGLGLDVSGLGVSGNQVQLALDQAKLEYELMRDAWALIDKALGWRGDGGAVIAHLIDRDGGGRADWRVAAERWRDRYYRPKPEAAEVRQ